VADLNLDIWRMQAQGDVNGLLNLLHYPTPDVRRRAIMALRTMGATGAIPALQTALITEKDTPLRALLLAALDDLLKLTLDNDDKEALERQHKIANWIAQLSSPNAEHVIRAAQNLADLQAKIAVETLVLVFRNPNLLPRVRLAAAEALLKLESAPVEVTLLAALRNPDWRTRRNAAGVLGQLHADWAVEALAAALHDPQEVVRRTAYAALKRLDTPEARRATEMRPSLAIKLATATSELPVVRLTPDSSPTPEEQGSPPPPETKKTAAAQPVVETANTPAIEMQALQPEQPAADIPEAAASETAQAVLGQPVTESAEKPEAAPSETVKSPLEQAAPAPESTAEPLVLVPPAEANPPVLPPGGSADVPLLAPTLPPQPPTAAQPAADGAHADAGLLPIPDTTTSAEPPVADEDTQPVAPIVDEDVS
jgi:hypothetical protein